VLAGVGMGRRIPSLPSGPVVFGRRGWYQLVSGQVLCSVLLLLVVVGPVTAQEAGRVVSLQGTVEVLRAGQWQPVSRGKALSPGEVVRTGPGSRVAIQLADESQLKINANSQLQLRQVAPPLRPVAKRVVQTLLRLLSGEIWIRSYAEPLEIETVAVTATIRGTELNLSIGPADFSRLAVLEGLVEFRNPQGTVLVAAGEQATAKVGEAPRRTVLLNPLDAVQWSLYYPGIVSYRDYPLSGIKPELLREQLGGFERRVASAPQDAEALVTLGEVLFDLGRRREAREAFARALRLAPQNLRAHTGLGWVYLEEGEVKAALKHFRQAQPPTLGALVGMINALYRLNRFEQAREVIAKAKGRFPDASLPWIQSALVDLTEGRVGEALGELTQALARDPNHALAHGLRSNIYLVQNQKELAHKEAQQAITANPFSPSAYLDLSLVKQAEFELAEGLQAAQKVVELDPDNAQALIQVSRLLFGLGRISEAFKIAEEARRRAPQDPVVTATWGFLQLARDHVTEAMAAFDQAIEQDSTRGEPHLGKGLALFRRGKTEEGEKEMRIATLLEPKVSLYHSYLGKAFYEVKEERLAEQQFALAKELDPRDPTPWFYEAIRKQTVNRPVEALQDLQQSITLNDNRAVYRSRLLLDEDLAMRGTSLARIYDDLGFDQLALVEASKSVSFDPANHSAHRFLSDTYARLPRHEIARVSELLQAQLLQPINIDPLQPSIEESDLNIVAGAGPARTTFNEFTPLFERNRLRLVTSMFGGSNDTWGDELVLSGLRDHLSFSLGQFHSDTNGFRENNDTENNFYNIFAQIAVMSWLNLQAEYRRRETEQGDIQLNFDPNNFSTSQRYEIRQDKGRLGGHVTLSPQSDVIASFIYGDFETATSLIDPVTNIPFEQVTGNTGYQIEAQYLFRSNQFNLIAGVGRYDIDVNRRATFGDFVFPEEDFSREQDTVYIYNNINWPNNLIWTAGVSYDYFQDAEVDLVNDVNAKLGLQWSFTNNLRLRSAYIQTVKRPFIVQQSIEPTQVAGFNQFFDDFAGTEATRYGIGLDAHLTEWLSGGLEASRRELTVPMSIIISDGSTVEYEDWREDLYKGYLYWAPHREWVAGVEYRFERFKLEKRISSDLFRPTRVETMSVPFEVAYFNPLGFFAKLGATYVRQQVELGPLSTFDEDSDEFVVVEIGAGYRLPNRWGILSVDVRNLLDENFLYQDDNFRTFELRAPAFIPDRTIFATLTLYF
jgi:tetratricopeptide (TPR) repeat protein